MARSKCLTTEEYNKILELGETNMLQKDIAAKVGRCAATVCDVLKRNGKIRDPNAVPISNKKVTCHEVEEQDLSSLPDNILFKHDTSFIL